MITFTINIDHNSECLTNINSTDQLDVGEFRRFLDIAEDIYKVVEDWEINRKKDFDENAK